MYDEVAPDEGDMDMFKIAQALDEVGYKGVLDYDHPNAVNLIGDGPQHKIYVAYLVGYNPRHFPRRSPARPGRTRGRTERRRCRAVTGGGFETRPLRNDSAGLVAARVSYWSTTEPSTGSRVLISRGGNDARPD